MSSSMPDFKAMARHDQIALGSGVLVFIASFLPWYGASFAGQSVSVTAWHHWAPLGLILLLIALVVTAGEMFAKDSLPALPEPLSYPIVEAVLACVGALIVLIRSLDLPSGGGGGFSYGLRWGGWILLIAVVAQAAVSVLRVVHANDGNTGGPAGSPPLPPGAPPAA